VLLLGPRKLVVPVQPANTKGSKIKESLESNRKPSKSFHPRILEFWVPRFGRFHCLTERRTKLDKGHVVVAVAMWSPV